MKIGIAIVLALVAVSLPGCGRTLVYEPVSAGNGEKFTLTAKRFTRYPVSAGSSVQDDMRILPKDAFNEAPGPGILGFGCWRFETSDGTTVTNKRGAIVALIDGDLILPEYSRGQMRFSDLLRVISAEPFALEVQGRRVMAYSVTREDGHFVLKTQEGRREIVEAGRARIVPYEGKAFGVDSQMSCNFDGAYGGIPTGLHRPPIFAIDNSGHAYMFVLGCDETNLTKWLANENDWSGLARFEVIPMRAIRRWEFDKPWGLTPFVDYALSVAAAAASLGFGCTSCPYESMYCP